MKTPTEVVSSFYDKLKTGDAPGALGLMAPDIEWITMWHFKRAKKAAPDLARTHGRV